jgi:lipid-binding SYLF domain-containing protein
MPLPKNADDPVMTLIRCASLVLLITASTCTADSEKRIDHAASAFQQLMRTPDKGIPRDPLERANCIIIIPGLKKGAFGFGGKYGRGFAACRRGSAWGAPAAVRIEGASIGFQIGGSSTDVFMLVMNAAATPAWRLAQRTMALPPVPAL